MVVITKLVKFASKIRLSECLCLFAALQKLHENSIPESNIASQLSFIIKTFLKNDICASFEPINVSRFDLRNFPLRTAEISTRTDLGTIVVKKAFLEENLKIIRFLLNMG